MPDDTPEPLACLVEGSAVATRSGERAVETLAIGDLVETRDGALRPIRWLGRAAVGGAGHPLVLVEAGALDDYTPARDLLLTPDHGLLIDGVLVAAGLLVNGSTVRLLEDGRTRCGVAVELDTHDVLLVDGAPVESFADCDQRGGFDNAAEHAAGGAWDEVPRWTFCAPRLSEGPGLERIATQVRRRAETLARSSETGTTVVGYLDTADRFEVGGWAFDTAHPEERVALDVVVDGVCVATIYAETERADVRAAGYGSGLAGYGHRFSPPLSPFEAHDVDVRIARDAASINGSPRALEPARALDDATIDEFTAALESTAALTGDTDHALRLLSVAVERLRAACAADAEAAAAEGTGPDPDAGAPLVLVIDDTIPDPGRDAGSQAIVSHVLSLHRLGWRVVYVPADQSDAPCPAFDLPDLSIARRQDFRSVENTLRHHGAAADAVYIHRLSNMTRFGALARLHCPRATLLYCVADLHFLRLGRQAALLRSPDMHEDSRLTGERELTAVLQADVVLTHSRHEAALLRETLPDADIRVIPWAVSPGPAPRPFAERRGIAFVGGAKHKPNLDAAFVIITELAPRLRAAGVDIPVVLIGEGIDVAAAGMQLDPAVEALGHVDDLAGVLGDMRLTVAPIRFGAGVKGKVVQSYALGLPCVTSPLGAEGIGLPDALARATVAADIDAMVDLILALHADEEAHRAATEASLAVARDGWSEQAVDAAFEEILGDAWARRSEAA